MSCDPAHDTRVALDALRATGQRGILLFGWTGLHRA
jgi:hypothetical protein